MVDSVLRGEGCRLVSSFSMPMLVASCEEDYRAYIEWLADYLYRPSVVPDDPLSGKDAGLELIALEIEIASAILADPHGDYPPQDRLPANGARHADILHREAMSRTLSRVPDRALRIQLLDDFYIELITAFEPAEPVATEYVFMIWVLAHGFRRMLPPY